MKKNIMTFIVCTFLLSCASSQQVNDIKKSEVIPKTPNLYLLNDTIKSSLREGIEVIKKTSATMEIKDSDFYFLFNKQNDMLHITVNYCQSCPHSMVVKSTDRFVELSKELFIPVIFNFDLEYSRFLFDNSGIKIEVSSIGGYLIMVNNKGRILKEGLQQ